MDTDFHTITNAQSEIQNPPAEISVGNKVWIGCRSLILKGSVIPDGCIIAANSLVTKELNGINQVFGKQPLRVLSQNISWH
jgi:acetyltransferase-like isoleucine patch superfamily enzyme